MYGYRYVYEYRYVDDDDRPVVRCPECDHDWTEQSGVLFASYIDGRVTDHRSRLDSQGNLIDVEDLIANGYHSGTMCGNCGEQLIDMKGVYEELN